MYVPSTIATTMSKPLTAPRGTKLPRQRILSILFVLLTVFGVVGALSSVFFLHYQPRRTPPLTFITMLFGNGGNVQVANLNPKLVSHNCALIAPTRHKYIIFTDDMTRPYCKVCECRLFVPRNCHLNCADPTKGSCNHCEKLLLIRDSVFEFNEFVFLDSDLIIVKEEFLERLALHAVAHDFLASYGFRTKSNDLERNINSGLFFMRRVPSANYSELMNIMSDLETNSDQATISRFVFKYYKNWDSLSRRWHCRLSYVRTVKFPLSECYTFHGKGIMHEILKEAHQRIRPLS